MANRPFTTVETLNTCLKDLVLKYNITFIVLGHSTCGCASYTCAFLHLHLHVYLNTILLSLFWATVHVGVLHIRARSFTRIFTCT
jgi:hypothetical protein